MKYACALVVAAAVALLQFPVAGQAPAPRKKVLALTHAALLKHASIAVAEKALPDIGAAGGIEITVKGDGRPEANRPTPEEVAKFDLSFLNPTELAQYDAILMFTNGNLPTTPEQRKALLDFVANGKGIVGVHCATVTYYDDPRYGEMMGAYYLRSILPTDARPNRFAVLKVEDPSHPATRMLGTSWPFVEEYYIFGRWVYDPSKPKENVSAVGQLPIPMAFSRDRVHVLLSVDTERTDLTDLPHVTKGGDYPQAWWRDFGKGRAFYTSLGHRSDSWSNPVFRAHLVGALRWATRLE